MFSNRTLLALAEIYVAAFSQLSHVNMRRVVDNEGLHDFFFAYEYPEALVAISLRVNVDSLKNLIIRVRPGTPILSALDGGKPDRQPELAESLQRRLVEDLFAHASDPNAASVRITSGPINRLVACLSLDGYDWRDGRVVRREENVLDVKEQGGALSSLYQQLRLEQPEQVDHDLALADEHYLAGHWGDCVKHARDVMEHSLMGVARAQSKALGKNLPRTALPGPVRAFLSDNGVTSSVEREFLFGLHTLLSVEGGHANMSEREHARISRQYALTAAHFILLRWEKLSANQGATNEGTS